MLDLIRPRLGRLLLVALFLLHNPALAAFTCQVKRNPAVVRDFQRLAVCPSTLRRGGPCPGYVIDHKWPLCACGPDQVANLEYQDTVAAKAKDAVEKRQCAALRKAATP